MKLTVGRKLGLMIGILLSLFLILGFVTHTQIRWINANLAEIIDVEEPTSSAAYEMEINLIGTGFGLLGYLEDRDPKHLERIDKDIADFLKYQKMYNELAETKRGRELGIKLAEEYNKFKDIASEIIKHEDEQDRRIDILYKNHALMDDLLDEKIQASIKESDPQAYKKLEAAMEMEINVNGIAKGLGEYLRTHETRYEERVLKDEDDFERFFAVYITLDLTAEERQWAKEIGALFAESAKLSEEIMALDKNIGESRDEFVKLRRNMDALMDDEVQILTRKDLIEAERAANRSVAIANTFTLGLIIIGFIIAIASSLTITKIITKPIVELKHAVAKVGSGELDTKMNIKSDDEIGDLAIGFSQMTKNLAISMEKEKKFAAAAATAAAEREKTTELEKAYMDLKRQSIELKDAQDKLVRSEKLAVLGKLGGAVGHELRNPLGAIRNSVYFIRLKLGQALKDKKIKEHLDILDEEVNISDRIITDILTFGRVKEPQLTKVNIDGVIEGSLARVKVPENIKVSKDLKKSLPQVPADGEQLKQVFSNIILNAIQAMPKGGMLTITGTTKDKFLELDISDTGEGISKENLNKIFEPLFSTKIHGTGLGLPVCQSNIEGHRGTINAEGEVGKGTKFTVKLPLNT